MVDYVRFRGDTYPIPRTMRSKKTGAIEPIAGYSFKMTINTLKSPTNEVDQVFQMIGVITDEDLGEYQFTPSTAQAANTGDMFYDIEAVDAGGLIETVDKGKYDVDQDITKT